MITYKEGPSSLPYTTSVDVTRLDRGGMPSIQLSPLSGRYLTFAEREEIALLNVQGVGVRAISRALERSPSTISRELRRNAATRGAKLEYQIGRAHV